MNKNSYNNNQALSYIIMNIINMENIKSKIFFGKESSTENISWNVLSFKIILTIYHILS